MGVSQSQIPGLFPHIVVQQVIFIQNIIQFLSGDPAAQMTEKRKMQLVYQTTDRDLMLENEVVETVEAVKMLDYDKYTSDNHVTQGAIRTYLLPGYQTLDLFRIFDNFRSSPEFPFVHYMAVDGPARFKIYEETTKHLSSNLYSKWLEGSSYGINLKMGLGEPMEVEDTVLGSKEKHLVYPRYMTVNIIETGRLDYKVQWRESDGCTAESALESREYIYRLVDKINEENRGTDGVRESPS